ncbi:hypothetical protein OHB24_35625 [Kribbella sp. NBC_00482]|uniref:hypothetical protein n=1 Tax=Kribbella sp. NBC_00482 TaxID=2975968 RepID=UPI002E197545
MHELEGDPSRVVKQFGRSIPGAEEDFQRLVEAGHEIAKPLAGLPIAFCWPEEAIVRSGLSGYVMPKLDPRFYYDFGEERRLRTLDHAIPKRTAFSLPFTVSDADRLTLVQLVAAFLESMHGSGVVYGDLSWGNFSFDPNSGVHLAVYDVDSSRLLGSRSFTRQAPASTADWDDPEAPDLPVATLDADRYKFALLAYRLLVAHNFDGRIDPARITGQISGLGPEDSRQLKALWTRAAGPRGTRPQLAEWTRLLGRPTPAPLVTVRAAVNET